MTLTPYYLSPSAMVADFPHPFVVVNAQGQLVAWSIAARPLFSTEKPLTPQTHVWDVFPPAWVGQIKALHQQVLATQQPGTGQVYEQNQATWWQINAHPGQPGQVSFSFWDYTATQARITWLEAQLAELRQWHDRFQTIAQISQQVFWEWQLEEDLTLWMGDTVALFGYSPAEMPQTGQAWLALLHPEDRLQIEAGWRSSLKDQAPYCCEYRIRCQDGHYCWVRDCVQYLKTESGHLRLLGVITDITFRKEAAAVVANNELRFKNLIANLPGHVFRCANDPNWTIQYLSDNIAQTVGYPASDFINNVHRTFASIIHPEDQEYVYNTIQECFKTQSHYGVEYRVIRADGAVRWFYESGQAIYDAAGIPQYIDGIAMDVTLQKQAELELAKSESRFRQLVEDVDVGVIVHNPAGEIILANQRAAEVLGITLAQLLGKSAQDPVWDIIDAFGNRLPPEQFPSVQATQQLQAIREVVLGVQRPQQGLAWLQVTAEPDFNEQQQLQQVIVTLSDITQRKIIEDALRYQSEREQALNRVIKAIRNSLDLTEIFQATLTELGLFLDVERVVIVQYRNDLREWHHVSEFRSSPSVPEMAGMVIPDSENLIAARLKRGETVIIDQAEHTEHLDSFNRELFQTFPGNWVIMPLQAENNPWGALSIHRMVPTVAWQPSDISLMEVVADQLAVAIRQAELYQSLEAANQELKRLSITDELTQIANRRHFDETLVREWQRLLREQAPLSLIFCDVDDFKAYNDLYGHPAGDHCLYLVAQALVATARRAVDLVARYGGEEFAIILPHTDAPGAIQVVENIQATLQGLAISHSGSRVSPYVTVSFGISITIPNPNSSPVSLLKSADQALYQAKQNGRNTYRVIPNMPGDSFK